jgi:hypothetical protein
MQRLSFPRACLQPLLLFFNQGSSLAIYVERRSPLLYAWINNSPHIIPIASASGGLFIHSHTERPTTQFDFGNLGPSVADPASDGDSHALPCTDPPADPPNNQPRPELMRLWRRALLISPSGPLSETSGGSLIASPWTLWIRPRQNGLRGSTRGRTGRCTI